MFENGEDILPKVKGRVQGERRRERHDDEALLCKNEEELRVPQSDYYSLSCAYSRIYCGLYLLFHEVITG